MAAINYYIGVKRDAVLNTDLVTAGTSSGGTAVDVEVRMQIDNGSNATGLTKLDVLKALCVLEDFIEINGLNHAGANLPAI